MSRAIKEKNGRKGHGHVMNEVAEQVEVSRQLGGPTLRRTFLLLYLFFVLFLLFFPGFQFAITMGDLDSRSVASRSLDGMRVGMRVGVTPSLGSQNTKGLLHHEERSKSNKYA